MAGPYVQYAGEHDTGRGPSFNLWNRYQSAIDEIQRGNLSRGQFFCEDFTEDITGKYVVTQSTAGTLVITDGFGGIGRFDSGSTTTAQGINVQGPDNNHATPAAAEIWLPVASQQIVFEARVRFNEDPAASPPDFFLGLSEKDTSLIATGANSSANHVGFELINEDATLDFVNEKAGTRSTTSDVKTLVEDTWYKLGFEILALDRIKMYIDGVLYTTEVTSNIPIVELAISLSCLASGTAAAQPEVDCDWIQVLQQTAAE